MQYKISVIAFWFPLCLMAQTGELPLSLPQASVRMREANPALQIADRAVGMARGERQKMNAFWYPTLNASGAFVHLSQKVEVRQPLSRYTEPAKDFVHSILPDDQIISSILDQVGTNTLVVPILNRNLSTVDANLSWAVFTGGRRIFASRIGNRMVDLAEVNRQETGAVLQTGLVQTYYALRLATEVEEVRKEAAAGLRRHYEDALKLEAQGMITKAERLFAEVNLKEAEREWDSARKEVEVARKALRALLDWEDEAPLIVPISPLFITESLPDSLYFKNLITGGSYTVGKLRLEETIAENQLKISRSAYLPTIALIGRQTLYAHNLPSHLMPRTMIGIGFTWNLFDGLNREADVRLARLTRESVSLGRRKAENDLGVLVQKLYTELLDAQDEASTLRATIDLSRELLRIRRKAFEEGMATSTEVVDAEVMLSKVRVAMLLAYYQFDVSLASLCSTCGVPEMFWKFLDSPQITRIHTDE